MNDILIRNNVNEFGNPDGELLLPSERSLDTRALQN